MSQFSAGRRDRVGYRSKMVVSRWEQKCRLCTRWESNPCLSLIRRLLLPLSYGCKVANGELGHQAHSLITTLRGPFIALRLESSRGHNRTIQLPSLKRSIGARTRLPLTPKAQALPWFRVEESNLAFRVQSAAAYQ